jgi:hypothetical protein
MMGTIENYDRSDVIIDEQFIEKVIHTGVLRNDTK